MATAESTSRAGFVAMDGDDDALNNKDTKGPIEGIDLVDHPNMTKEEREMKEEELSFYSASENDHGDDNIWGLLSGVGGNIFEW